VNIAKSLIERQRKLVQTINDKPEKFVDPLEQADRMEQDIFYSSEGESDEEANNYHLLEDVIDLKKRNLNASLVRNMPNSKKPARQTKPG
jgi:hypothetical protein